MYLNYEYKLEMQKNFKMGMANSSTSSKGETVISHALNTERTQTTKEVFLVSLQSQRSEVNRTADKEEGKNQA